MRRPLIAAVTAVTMLGACSFGDEAPKGGSQEVEDVVDFGGLPPSCDDLVTPLAVATALNGEPAGGRSAVYSPPNSSTEAVAGMTCSFGVGEGQPAVTVEAVAYTEEDSAADQYAAIIRRARRDAASQEALDVMQRPGLLARMSDRTAYHVLDGRRTLSFTVSQSAADPAQASAVLMDLAESVVGVILSSEPTSQEDN